MGRFRTSHLGLVAALAVAAGVPAVTVAAPASAATATYTITDLGSLGGGVTHGLAMRLFCMRWFHWTVAEFESLSNPGNAEVRMLVLGDDGKYTMDRPFDRWREPEPSGTTGWRD